MRLSGDPLDVRELRIGNIVLHNDVPIRVERLTTKFVQHPITQLVNHIGGDINIGLQGRVFGVKLTKQWVEKLGFQNIKDSLWKLDSVVINETWGAFLLEEVDYRHLRFVEYVHELQNLMFALRGFEDDVTL